MADARPPTSVRSGSGLWEGISGWEGSEARRRGGTWQFHKGAFVCWRPADSHAEPSLWPKAPFLSQGKQEGPGSDCLARPPLALALPMVSPCLLNPYKEPDSRLGLRCFLIFRPCSEGSWSAPCPGCRSHEEVCWGLLPIFLHPTAVLGTEGAGPAFEELLVSWGRWQQQHGCHAA